MAWVFNSKDINISTLFIEYFAGHAFQIEIYISISHHDGPLLSFILND